MWNDPADGVTRYNGVPPGYSVYLNGTRAFTVDRLTRVLHDPATGSVTLPSGGSVVHQTAVPDVRAPRDVVQSSARVVDVFVKAGVDLTSTRPNLAQGAAVSASYTASGTSAGAAVDGFPINEPIWGSSGSPNGTDSFEIDFRQQRTAGEVWWYFRDDRAGNRYRAPSPYQVQYWNGSGWADVTGQTRTPSAPRANYNQVRFDPVGTQRLRVQLTHAPGFRTGLTEIKVHQTEALLQSGVGPELHTRLVAFPPRPVLQCAGSSEIWGDFMRWLLIALVGALTLVGVQPLAAQAEPVVQALDEGNTFVPMSPRRVLDTRDGTGTGGKIEPVRSGLQLDLSAALPASATAVVLNLTGTEPTSGTYVRVSPVNYNVPDISNLNLSAGETRANQVTVAVPADRKIWLFNNAGAVHLVADVAGYYTTDSGSRFTTTAPTRLVDTRSGAPVGPASTIEVDLSGVVPASATSVTFNLTGTQPTSTTFVTATPSGTARPPASNLNLVAGQTSPNLVTVALGTNRRVTLYNNLGTVHLIVDLAGYYASDRGHRFFPVSPVRSFDTRYMGGTVGPGQTRVVDLGGGIPPTAAAAVLNLTGAAPTSVTFVTAHANGTARPITSNLNLTPGRDTANAAVVALGGDARMALYNNAGSTHLIVDLAGFFGTPASCVGDCVYGWGGYSGYGPTPALRPWLSGITSVDASTMNALALRTDGTVWSWGDNQFGQLGAGGTGGKSTVPLRVSGLTGVTEVASGTWTNYALKSDGTVWSWGWNDEGQLGTGQAGDSNVPVRVYGLTGVTAIAATHQTAYALKSDGTVWAWGNDVWDGLGSAECPPDQVCPPGTPRRVPVPLPAGTTVTAIAAGASETAYALRSDGTAWAWGRNWDGETGTGAPLRDSEHRPTQVVGLTGVVSIAGGDEVGYATTSDGKVWAWGENYWGTLGRPCADPNTCQSTIPVEVQGLTGPLVIESGAGTTFALKEDGSVWAWGRNADTGNLGNGTTGPCNVWPLPEGCQSNTPVRTSIGGVKDVAAGGLGKYAVVP